MARDGLRSLLLTEAEAGITLLPEPPRFTGVEFLEFAVDEDSGRRLGETLRGLGFRYAGRHRSKSVDLFRQGDINCILNSEQDSAAAEHFQFHGPSVCAMAFRVDDAQRAVLVPRPCCARNGMSARDRREASLPALRAPDGTLLYLIEPRLDGTSIYDVDFHLVTDEGNAGPLHSVIMSPRRCRSDAWTISSCSTGRFLAFSRNSSGRSRIRWG